MPLALSRGGCEVQLINLLSANRLSPAVDYRVCFLANGPMVDAVKNLGYPVHVIPAGRLRNPFKFIAAVIRLALWIRRNRIAYVISWMEKAHIYACPAAILARVPAAWWLRSIDPQSRLLKFIAALPARQVFACSHAAARALSGPKARDITVCYSAVDLTRYNPDALPSPADARAALGLPADRPIVAMVARLQRWKGINEFVEAAAIVLSKDPRPLFLVVGGDHDLEPGVRAEAQSRVNLLGLPADVRFVGYQPNVPLWMQAADVIVHASIKPEPLGIVVVEAMAMAKPVVASRAGGPLEIISDGIDGRLFTPGDPTAMAAAIAESLVDSPANAHMKSLARQSAAKFNASRMADELARDLGLAAPLEATAQAA
jgi:glycosyltransferase involved in cell wall biosynthesis